MVIHEIICPIAVYIPKTEHRVGTIVITEYVFLPKYIYFKVKKQYICVNW